MNIKNKIIQLSSLLAVVALFWSAPVLAQTDFELEVDPDGDGICGSSISDEPYYLGPYWFCEPHEGEPDNCPDVANPTQTDTDADGVGDACEADDQNDQGEDSDKDGIPDCQGGEPLDLCPPPPADLVCPPDPTGVNNTPPAQLPSSAGFPCITSLLSETNDLDGDGEGDVCDLDIDGDNVLNDDDCNCIDPTVTDPPEGSDVCLAPGANPNTGQNPNDLNTSNGCSLVSMARAVYPSGLMSLIFLFLVPVLGLRLKIWLR